MNDIDYTVAYAHWQKSIPFTNPEERHSTMKKLVDSASPEHAPTTKAVSYMSDQTFCACGWESGRYFDGIDFALEEWRKHVMGVTSDE